MAQKVSDSNFATVIAENHAVMVDFWATFASFRCCMLIRFDSFYAKFVCKDKDYVDTNAFAT